MADIHPFYEAHRGAMEAAMRQRLDLAETMLSERTQLSDLKAISQEVMDEFAIVLTQTPYVGGAVSRMSDFFCGLDFDAYASRGIHLERTQTLAGGASHCNFRFSQLKPS